MKKIFLFLYLCLFMVSASVADIYDLNMTPYFEGLDDGSYDLEIVFSVSGNLTELIVTGSESTISIDAVDFVNGYASVYLTDLDITVLTTANLIATFTLPNDDYTNTVDFHSASYAIYSQYAEEVLYPDAESLVSSSIFTNVVTTSVGVQTYISSDDSVEGGIMFSNSFPVISDGDGSSDYAIDWLVSVNVSEAFYRDGVLLTDSFDWQFVSDANALYFLDNVGIGITREPNNTLEIAGAVFADDFYEDGTEFSSLDEWSYSGDDLYFDITSGRVGIGESSPDEQLHVEGGILLLTGNYQTMGVGTLYRHPDTGHFYGIVYDDDGATESIQLDLLTADGIEDGIAYFSEASTLTADDYFLTNQSGNKNDSIQLLGENSFMYITNSDMTVPYFKFFSEVGENIVSFNTTNNLKYLSSTAVSEDSIAVNGTFNALNYYLDGAPLVFRMSKGDIFLRSTTGYTETTASIYYDDGFVSIGSFDPVSALELNSPYREIIEGVVTKDPVISFSMVDGDDVERYTMGLDPDELSLFLIEYGDTLGADNPLLAIQQDFISVGNKDPKANLHVSGNTGLLMEGSLDFFDDDPSVTENIMFFENSGTKMLFNAYNSSFRAGTYVDGNLDFDQTGLGSVGLGEEVVVFGTFATGLSGYDNLVEGAYSTGMSGSSNTIEGYFSLGLGVGAGIYNDGSFVYAQPGILGSGSVDVSSELETKSNRQFLIGNPSSDTVSYLSSSVGINTSESNATLTLQGVGLTWESFQDEFNLSMTDAKRLFEHLVDEGFLDDSDDTFGFLQLPQNQYFKDSYKLEGYSLPLIISIESDEFYSYIVNTLRDTSTYEDEDAILDLIEAYYTDDELIEPYYDVVNERIVTNEQVSFYNVWVKAILSENSQDILDTVIATDLIYSYTDDDTETTYTSYSNTDSLNDGVEKALQDFCENTDYANDDETFVTINLSTEVLGETVSVYSFIYYYIREGLGFGTEDNPVNTDISDTFKWADIMYIVQEDIEDDVTTMSDCSKVASQNMSYAEIYDILYDYEGQYTSGEGDYSYYSYTTEINENFDTIRQSIYDELNDIITLTAVDSDTNYLLSHITLPYDMTDQTGQDITTENIFDFLVDHAQHEVLSLRGLDGQTFFSVFNNGSVGIGFSQVDKANIAISSNISVYGQYASTDYFDDDVYEDFLPKLAVFNPRGVTPSAEEENTLLVGSSVYPDFVINSSGNIGVAGNPTLNFSLSVFGTLYTNSMSIMNEDGSTVEITAEEPVIVWGYDSDYQFIDDPVSTTPNIYFVTGNVGIGTAFSSGRVKELLHLSVSKRIESDDPSSDYLSVIPFISFDHDNGDHVLIGMNSDEGLIIGTPESVNDDIPELFITSQNVLIGTTNIEKDVELFVDGRLKLEGIIRVGYDDVDTSAESFSHGIVGGDISTEYMFMRSGTSNTYQKVTASGLAWNVNDNSQLYLNDGTYIGIGFSNPSTMLDVNGVISANAMIVTNELQVSSINLTEGLEFYNLYSTGERYNSTDTFDFFYDEDELLFLSTGYVFSLSDLLTLGSGEGGYITNFIDDDTLTTQNTNLLFQWDSTFSSDVLAENYWNYSDELGFYASGEYPSYGSSTLYLSQVDKTGVLSMDVDSDYIDNSIVFAAPPLVGIQIDASVDYDGNYWTDSYSHSFVSLNLVIEDNTADADATYVGYSLKMDNINENNEFTTLASNTLLYGAYINMEEVSVQDSGDEIRGYRYSSIFMGDVMIGSLAGRDLDELKDGTYNLISIDGSVQANSFNISDRLITSYMNISNLVFIDSGKVGIGTETPLVEFEIVGDIEGSDTNFQQLQMQSYAQSDNKFVTTTKGFVGFGTNSDEEKVDVVFSKTFTTYDDYLFPYKYYDVTLPFTDGSATAYDVTLLSIDIETQPNNFLGSTEGNNVRGLHIDLSGLDFYPDGRVDLEIDNVTSNIFGLYVVVTDNVQETIGKTAAAVFYNGNVGIGDTQPDSDYSLVVNGDIFARSVDSTSFDNLKTVPDDAVVHTLTVSDNLYIADSVTVNIIHVKEKILYSSAVLENLDLSDFKLKSDYVEVDGQLDIDKTFYFESITNGYMLKGVTGSIQNNVYSTNSGTNYTFQSEFDGIAYQGDFNTLDANLATINTSLSIGSDYFLFNYELSDFDDYYHPAAFELPGNVGAFSSESIASWNVLVFSSGTSNANTVSGIVMSPFDDPSGISSAQWAILSELEADFSAGADAELSMYFSSVDVDSDGNEELSSAPSLYIASSGNIGIGLSSPSFNLDVNGGSLVESSLDVTGNISFSGIEFLSNAVFPEVIDVMVTMNFETVSINYSLSIASINADNNEIMFEDSAVLFYNEEDDGFYISRDYNDETAAADLRIKSTYKADTFLYFTDANILDSMPFGYVSHNIYDDYFIITANFTGSKLFSFETLVTSSDSTTSDLEFHSIDVLVTDRTDYSISDGLYGKYIDLNSSGGVVGVQVDLSNLLDSTDLSIYDNSVSTTGQRYGALFSGGAVWITSRNNYEIKPKSNLLVENQDRDNDYSSANVIIDSYTSTGVYDFLVTSSNVGLGISTKNTMSNFNSHVLAQLFVSNNSLIDPLAIYDSSSKLVFSITDDGTMFFGSTVEDNSNLGIDLTLGSVSSQTDAGSLSSKTLNIDTVNIPDMFFSINDSEKVGLGTSDASSQFDIYTLVESQENYISQLIDFQIEDNSKAVVGYSIELMATGNAVVAGKVIGLDMPYLAQNSLELEDEGILYGASVDVGDNYGLVFVTGNVGIGTSLPNYALDIDGTLAGSSLISVSSNVTITATEAIVDVITANVLTIQGEFSGSTINVTGTLTFAELQGDMSLDTLLAANQVRSTFDGVNLISQMMVSTLNIGGSANSNYSFYVSTNTTESFYFNDDTVTIADNNELTVDTFTPISSEILVEADIEFNSKKRLLSANIVEADKLLLSEQPIDTRDGVFSVNSDDDLLFGDLNLTSLFSPVSGNVFAFYDSNQNVSNGFDFSFSTTSVGYDFTVSESVLVASKPLIQLYESVDTSTNYGITYAFKQLDIDVAETTGVDIYGVKLDYDKVDANSLIPSQTIGFSIDLSDLETDVTEIDNGTTTTYQGTRYAATFTGGTFLITSGNSKSMSANVVVENNDIVSASMIVDSTSSTGVYDLLISTINVGLGIPTRSGQMIYEDRYLSAVQLLVSDNSADDTLLVLSKKSGTQVLSVGETGTMVFGSSVDTNGTLGIDLTQSSTLGQIDAESVYVDTLIVDDFSDKDYFYFSSEGFVGINQSLPKAQLDYYSAVNEKSNQTAQLIDVSFSDYTGSAAGYKIYQETAANTYVSGRAYGLYMTYADLTLDDGDLYGFYLDTDVPGLSNDVDLTLSFYTTSAMSSVVSINNSTTDDSTTYSYSSSATCVDGDSILTVSIDSDVVTVSCTDGTTSTLSLAEIYATLEEQTSYDCDIGQNISPYATGGSAVFEFKGCELEYNDPYTLVFVTGNVGVGVTKPGYALTIDGSLHGSYISSVSDNVSITVTNATVNSIVAEKLSVSGNFTTSLIEVTDTLSFSVLSDSTLLDSLVATGNIPNEFDGIDVSSSLIAVTLNIGYDTQDTYVFYVADNLTNNGVYFNNADAEVTINETFNVNEFTSLGSDTIIDADVLLDSTRLSANVLEADVMLLTTSDISVDDNGIRNLALNKAGDLLYGSINLTEYLSTTNTNTFAFYNSSGDLSNSFDFMFVEQSEGYDFIVSESVLISSKPLIQLLSSVNASKSYGTAYDFKQLDIDVAETTGVDIYGVKLDYNKVDANSLIPSQTIGFSIDLSDLETDVTEIDNGTASTYQGTRYAATFVGGTFLITSRNNNSTSANVIVDNNDIVSASMIVDSTSSAGVYDLLISTMNVGLGIPTRSAQMIYEDRYLSTVQLLVSDNSADDTLLAFLDNDKTQVLSIGQTGSLVFGTEIDTTGDLGIDLTRTSGLAYATDVSIKTLNADKISIQQGSFLTISDEGFLGLGITNPSVPLDNYISIDEKADKLAQRIWLNLSYDGTYDKTVSAFKLGQQTADNTFVSGVAYGLKVDLTDIDASDAAEAYGVYMDVSNQNALVFVTGNVGVGISQPDYTLAIDGYLKSSRYNFDENVALIEVEGVSINNLRVLESLSGDGVITFSNTNANVSANYLEFETYNDSLDINLTSLSKSEYDYSSDELNISINMIVFTDNAKETFVSFNIASTQTEIDGFRALYGNLFPVALYVSQNEMLGMQFDSLEIAPMNNNVNLNILYIGEEPLSNSDNSAYSFTIAAVDDVLNVYGDWVLYQQGTPGFVKSVPNFVITMNHTITEVVRLQSSIATAKDDYRQVYTSDGSTLFYNDTDNNKQVDLMSFFSVADADSYGSYHGAIPFFDSSGNTGSELITYDNFFKIITANMLISKSVNNKSAGEPHINTVYVSHRTVDEDTLFLGATTEESVNTTSVSYNVNLAVSINESLSDFVLQEIEVQFDNRFTANNDENEFVGLDVLMTQTAASTGLSTRDYYGVHVSMDQLLSSYYDTLYSSGELKAIQASKVAGAFTGGQFMVIATGNNAHSYTSAVNTSANYAEHLSSNDIPYVNAYVSSNIGLDKFFHRGYAAFLISNSNNDSDYLGVRGHDDGELLVAIGHEISSANTDTMVVVSGNNSLISFYDMANAAAMTVTSNGVVIGSLDNTLFNVDITAFSTEQAIANFNDDLYLGSSGFSINTANIGASVTIVNNDTTDYGYDVNFLSVAPTSNGTLSNQFPFFRVSANHAMVIGSANIDVKTYSGSTLTSMHNNDDYQLILHSLDPLRVSSSNVSDSYASYISNVPDGGGFLAEDQSNSNQFLLLRASGNVSTYPANRFSRAANIAYGNDIGDGELFIKVQNSTVFTFGSVENGQDIVLPANLNRSKTPSTANVGLFVTDPQATFHVDRSSSTYGYLDVITAENNYDSVFHIDKNGYVGVKTTSPSTNFHVNGLFKIVDDQTLTIVEGNEFSIPSVSITEFVADVSLASANITAGTDFIFADLNLTIDNLDATQNLTAFGIEIVSENIANNPTYGDFPHYGLYVDLTDVQVADDGNLYSAVFYGETGPADSALSSKVAIDLTSLAYKDTGIDLHEGTYRRNEDCLDDSVCRDNIMYKYQLNVYPSNNGKVMYSDFEFTSSKLEFENTIPLPYVAFGASVNLTTDAAIGTTLYFQNALTTANFKKVSNDEDFPLAIENKSFVNLFSSDDNLASNLNDIRVALEDLSIIDSDGYLSRVALQKANEDNSSYLLDDSIGGVTSQNILGALNSLVTRNVYNMMVKYDIPKSYSDEDEICVTATSNILSSDGTINLTNCVTAGSGVGSSTTYTYSHTNVPSNASPYKRYFYPITLSSGRTPSYLSPYNVGHVAFNVATSNLTFGPSAIYHNTDTDEKYDQLKSQINDGKGYSSQIVSNNIVFTLGGFGTTGIQTNGDSASTYFYENSTYFTKSYGHFSNWDDYKASFQDTLYYKQQFVETDQHMLSIISDGTELKRYMSYKTRFQDMRLGKYIPYLETVDVQENDEVDIYFSGGVCYSDFADSNPDDCSENLDEFTMGRENNSDSDDFPSPFQSKLLINMTELNSAELDIQFSAGYTSPKSSTGNYYSVLAVGGGLAGGTGTAIPFAAMGNYWSTSYGESYPETLLSVIDDSFSEEATEPGKYIVRMQNQSNDSSADILSLDFSAIDAPDESNNYVSFMVNTGSDSSPVYDVLGEVEGYGGDNANVAGVQFSSPGNDYAEYIIKRDPTEEMNPGDVVGVFGGELSLQTEGADHIMVLSSSPIIVGNFPGEDVKHLYGLAAFLGQVKVRVVGVVEKGDILVASLDGDGHAFGVSLNDLLPEHMAYIIGEAWEDSDGSNSNLVNAVIGMPFNTMIINRYIRQLSDQLTEENKANKELEVQIKQQLDYQQQLIETLKHSLSSLED